MIDLIEYSNLVKSIFQYNAWKTDSSFPLNSCTAQEKVNLDSLMVKEWVFPGKYRIPKDPKILYKAYLDGVRNLILNEDDNPSKILFLTEHRPKKKSKLRSYKGIVDKKLIAQKDYIEQEFFVGQNETLIAAIVVLIDESYFDFIKTVFFDDSLSFIVSGSDFLPAKDLLNKICSEFLMVSGGVEINYLKLALDFCLEGKIIYRAGGDGGDDYWSLQCFKTKGDQC